MATTIDPYSLDDKRAMSAALGLARRGLGQTWPNPAVGCVLVRPDLGADGKGLAVGRGWTQRGGRPHAETVALTRAGDLAQGATAFVTLEPCCHYGETGPCTQALIEAGITRAVVAMEDPDPRVSGKGITALREGGIKTDVGLFADAAQELNFGFVSKVRRDRPMVTLKLATSLDGRIATTSGDSKWITGPAARARGHLLRAEHDVILVGRGTVTADDPELTCRLAGLENRSPIRAVMDSGAKGLGGSKLEASAAETPVWVIAGLDQVDADPDERHNGAKGVDIVPVTVGPDGRPAPGAVLKAFAEKGITRVLIEGGADVAASFMNAGLIDRIAWFRAPVAIGSAGMPGLAGLDYRDLRTAPRFQRLDLEQLGDDVLELLAVKQDAA